MTIKRVTILCQIGYWNTEKILNVVVKIKSTEYCNDK